MTTQAKTIALTLILAFSIGCESKPKKPTGLSGKPSAEQGSDQTPDIKLNCGEAKTLGSTPVKRLSRLQYVTSIRNLFGDLKSLDKVLTLQANSYEFGQTPDNTGLADLDAYLSAAEMISKEIISTEGIMNAVFPCAKDKDQEACAMTSIGKVARLAFRDKLAKTDLDYFQSLYKMGSKVSYEHGVELLVSGLLQSPRFLYLTEFGQSEKGESPLVRLNGNEVAARMSFAIWNSVPDEGLMDAADGGLLNSSEGIRSELKRMLKSPKGNDLYQRFLSEWIGLDQLLAKSKNETLYPEWKKEENRRAIHDQALAFFKNVMESEQATVTNLLTSDIIPQNAKTSQIFGIEGGKDDAFASVEGVKGHTSGLLSLPAFHVLYSSPDQSNPTMRGRFVREKVLCQSLPSAPGDIPEPPPFDPSIPTRQRHLPLLKNPACGACHKSMDLIGFGLENFDAIGKFRSEEAGMPVDNTGEIVAWPSDGKFQGVAELGEMLGQSDEVQACVAKLWFRFLLSRFEDDKKDSCYVDSIVKEFGQKGGTLANLPEIIMGNELFLYKNAK